jgi:hypothetical protein
MKMQKVVFILIGTMFLLAGKTSAQHVKTDYDRSKFRAIQDLFAGTR